MKNTIDRIFITTLVLLLCVVVQAQDRPNIVVILADDMGWGDSSTYGHKVTRTPSMDKLAAQGMKFTQG